MTSYTRWPGDDGYDRMNFARASGWEPLSRWGLDGWTSVVGRWSSSPPRRHGARDRRAGHPRRPHPALRRPVGANPSG
jgi:hypothetical protein